MCRRCVVCDYQYQFNFLSHFKDTDYCPVCEAIILETINEIEGEEDETTVPEG